ncbi:group III truncated hemoglobin [Zhouia sp. PK063]|uniref:group III truncated hemoglobin n=1 Tax=Zhouia sp. PK063 TaxID=3373602 RepID=UPI0037A9636A
MKKTISTFENIQELVDEFYIKVREDELIGPVFNQVIENRWDEHLKKMYSFWQTILLKEHTYIGSPFPPHERLPIEKKHFEQWLCLFMKTIDENFYGDIAVQAKWRAQKMAEIFEIKIHDSQQKNQTYR